MAADHFKSNLLHPALWQLLRFQASGKFKRVANAFCSRRKIIISVLALLLACIWLGQTVLAVILRQPADSASLQTWLSVSLFLYCLFHAIKIGCRKPIQPFEWTAAEKQILLTAPLRRAQLVTYRFISYFGAVFAKAACFSVVMIPDLPNFAIGFLAMLLGLTIVELFRVLLELIMWIAGQMGKRYLFATRILLLLPAFAICIFAFYQTAHSSSFQTATESTNPLALPQLFLAVVEDVCQYWFINFFMWPWETIVDLVLARHIDEGFLLKLASVKLLLAGMIALVYKVDRVSDEMTIVVSRKGISGDNKKAKLNDTVRKTRKPPIGLGGAKAIAWYQFLGAIHYKSTLVFALAIPTLLSCAPLMSKQLSAATGLSIIGSLVFYSFLLLPPALMLDFRRDARRLAVWKSTPISSVSLTIGQLAVPVALMSLFQLCVLAISVVVGGLTWKMMLAWPLFFPMNVVIIGMENAIFLLHPYRRNQEGIEVFLRTILTFTGKGVLFALGLALTLLWAFLSLKICSGLPGSDFTGPITFGIGTFVALLLLAWTSIKACSSLFERLDISQDLPAR